MRPSEKVHPSHVKGLHAWHQVMLMGAAIPFTSALEAFPSCSKWAPDQRRYLESATPNVIGSYFQIHLDNFVDVSVELIKSLGFNCQLITCSQRGSAGKEQSSCIFHSPWRSSAVLSPSWDWEHSTLGPCWDHQCWHLKIMYLLPPFVPCAMINEALSHLSSLLGWQWLRHSTWGHHLVLLNLSWCNCSSWEEWQKSSLSYEVFHSRHHPKLMLHTLHPQCTQAMAHFFLLPSQVWPAKLTFWHRCHLGTQGSFYPRVARQVTIRQTWFSRAQIIGRRGDIKPSL